MNTRTLKENKFKFFTLLFTSYIAFAQSENFTQDLKFEQLINVKRNINNSIYTNERYNIQIFSGTSEMSKKNLVNFKQEYKDIDATLIFNTPNYKVLVGNFKTRIEAERCLFSLRKKFKNAFIIKPNKNNS